MAPYTCFMTSPENIGQQFSSVPIYTGSGLAKDSRDWSKVSLAERRTVEASKEPGGRWGVDVALVPVAQLAKYTEFDRTVQPSWSKEYSDETIDSIADDLRKGGVTALRDTPIMTYSHKSRWGYVHEGNHRVAAAIRAGITHIPVRVTRTTSDLEHYRREGIGAPMHLDNRVVEESGYIPAYLHPGNFQEFEGAR